MHTGAHYTEQDRLIKSLLRNNSMLRARGVVVPPPSSYRSLVRDTLNAMNKAPAAPGARDVLLDVILEDAQAARVVLSDANFFRTAGTAVQGGVIYPAAPIRMKYMADLFPEDQLEICVGMRNPATFLPIVRAVAMDPSDSGFWGARSAYDVRWSEMIAGIRQTVPQAMITCWCSEDLPLIWGQVMRALAGVAPNVELDGEDDLLSTIMSKEGMQRYQSYLKKHPGLGTAHRTRVIAAFLDKFALDDAIEEELDMPGWTDEVIEDLTDFYDEDVEAIQEMPGVRVIEP